GGLPFRMMPSPISMESLLWVVATDAVKLTATKASMSAAGHFPARRSSHCRAGCIRPPSWSPRETSAAIERNRMGRFRRVASPGATVQDRTESEVRDGPAVAFLAAIITHLAFYVGPPSPTSAI